MREYLLPSSGHFYKANLHTHTTVSDGKMTPEEIKAAYKSHGYQIVAYTDHDVMVDHSGLSDDTFLALRGYEMAVDDNRHGERWNHSTKTYHLSLIASRPDVDRQVFFTQRINFRGNAAQYARNVLTTGEQIYSYVYSPIFINRLIRAANAAGFLVIYNHPHYSLQTGEDFLPLEGLLGMEIHNGASMAWGFGDDGDTAHYERMLRAGHTSLIPIAADDSHDSNTEDPANELFTGFTMIKAPSLSYTAVTAALKNGDCYASQAPYIHDLYVEDGHLHIECSRVREIIYRTVDRRAERRMSPDGLTSADFPISAKSGYFRLEIVDLDGYRAATRAYPAARYGK
jgi:hypothetical protein